MRHNMGGTTFRGPPQNWCSPSRADLVRLIEHARIFAFGRRASSGESVQSLHFPDTCRPVFLHSVVPEVHKSLILSAAYWVQGYSERHYHRLEMASALWLSCTRRLRNSQKPFVQQRARAVGMLKIRSSCGRFKKHTIWALSWRGDARFDKSTESSSPRQFL